MYPNNDIGHELYNFIPIVHSKVKSASLKSRYAATIESEAETETYRNKNLPRTNELFWLVKPAVRVLWPVVNLLGVVIPRFAETTPVLTLKCT